MQSLINANSTALTVAARAVYNALGMAAYTFLVTWAVDRELDTALIAAGIVALGSLGFRGLAEGIPDIRRDAKGQQLPGDPGNG